MSPTSIPIVCPVAVPVPLPFAVPSRSIRPRTVEAAQVVAVGPELGQDTDAMLQALAYTPETIARLRRDGIVG